MLLIGTKDLSVTLKLCHSSTLLLFFYTLNPTPYTLHPLLLAPRRTVLHRMVQGAAPLECGARRLATIRDLHSQRETPPASSALAEAGASRRYHS